MYVYKIRVLLDTQVSASNIYIFQCTEYPQDRTGRIEFIYSPIFLLSFRMKDIFNKYQPIT